MNVDILKCQQCGSLMEKTDKADKNFTLQLLGVVVFFVGLALLFVFPVGTVIGLFLMLIAARMGYKKRKVWKCGSCGFFFERA